MLVLLQCLMDVTM